MKISILVLVLAGFVSSAYANEKVGFVDMQKAIQSTAAGKKAKEQLDSEFQKRKAGLDKKKADIEKMGQDLDKKKSVLSEEVFNKKNLELQEEMLKFQKTVAENQTEIQKKERELLEPIFEKMKRVIEKVANEKSYAMVIEKNGQSLLFAKKETDLTDDVIKAFEKEK